MTTTPPTKPTRGVPIQMDRVRHLRFSLKTLRELREEFGKDVLETGFEGDNVARLLWYGMKWEDDALTVEMIEEEVDLENLAEIMQAVVKASGGKARVAVADPADPTPPASEEVPDEDKAEIVAAFEDGLAAGDEIGAEKEAEEKEPTPV